MEDKGLLIANITNSKFILVTPKFMTISDSEKLDTDKALKVVRELFANENFDNTCINLKE